MAPVDGEKTSNSSIFKVEGKGAQEALKKLKHIQGAAGE
jgi:hypothetical protein